MQTRFKSTKTKVFNVSSSVNCFVFFFKILLIFRERGREREREGEKHQCVLTSCAPPTGDPACNPGMCPHCNQTGGLLDQRLALIHWDTPTRMIMYLNIHRRHLGSYSREILQSIGCSSNSNYEKSTCQPVVNEAAIRLGAASRPLCRTRTRQSGVARGWRTRHALPWLLL